MPGGRPYEDDPVGIPPSARLLRRVNPRFCDWNALDTVGNPRVTRQAVQFYTEEMAAKVGCPGPALSVIVESLADPIEVLRERYAGDGLARVTAEVIRGDAGERGIQLWPTPEEPAHAVVFRADGGKDLPSSVKKRLAEHLSKNWVVPPSRHQRPASRS